MDTNDANRPGSPFGPGDTIQAQIVHFAEMIVDIHKRVAKPGRSERYDLADYFHLSPPRRHVRRATSRNDERANQHG